MDDSMFSLGLLLIDQFRWALLLVTTAIATFFIYTAIMYRVFLLSRQDASLLDIPGYPLFSYMILRRHMKPATILNRMPGGGIESALKEYEKQFKNYAVHSEDKKNAATAIAEYKDEHIYKELYIYWDRKTLETQYEAELRKNTKIRLEIIHKRRLRDYETIGKTRYSSTDDKIFDSKYTILTNRPNLIGQLSREFRARALKADIDKFIVEGKHAKVTTEHRGEIKDVMELLLEFEKIAGAML
ncbi:MAG: hypothetical protein WAX07_09920 [Candidatus Altiarchaeia archaeon]|jgi:uncharacterized protein (DUF4415 family)